MFTIEQINDAHDRLGNAATFAEYVRALHAIGVDTYSSFVSDGHSEYFGTDGYTVRSPAVHEELTIAGTANREQFLEHLNLHNEQKTTYMEMSRGLAESGVERWTVDTKRMSMTFYDKAGNELLVESIT
jgi:uncharacterized protein YbcV (DUF1398 family)